MRWLCDQSLASHKRCPLDGCKAWWVAGKAEDQMTANCATASLRSGEGPLQCLIPRAIKLARDRRVRNEDVKAVECSRNKVELCRHPG